MSANAATPVLSVVVPCYNEALGLPSFHNALTSELQRITAGNYELIYCNDGSRDDTAQLISNWRSDNKRVKLLSFSRNFGKEIATTAGITAARGQAILLLDADGQHPVEAIESFVETWRNGATVVVGLRTTNAKEGFVKRYGSKLFYRIFNRLTGTHLRPGATDFRLIDRRVQQDFVRLTERNRITRGLIDWLGYEQQYISFEAKARNGSPASYSIKKLCKLAIDSIISLSMSPLYLTAYLGAIVMPIALLLAIITGINWLLRDPLQWQVSGGGYLSILILFLIGLLLVSQGIIGLYLSHIHAESQNRPLYIIDRQTSQGIDAS